MTAVLKRHRLNGWMVHKPGLLPHLIADFRSVDPVIDNAYRIRLVDAGEMLNSSKVDQLVDRGCDNLTVIHQAGGVPFYLEIEPELML